MIRTNPYYIPGLCYFVKLLVSTTPLFVFPNNNTKIKHNRVWLIKQETRVFCAQLQLLYWLDVEKHGVLNNSRHYGTEVWTNPSYETNNEVSCWKINTFPMQRSPFHSAATRRQRSPRHILFSSLAGSIHSHHYVIHIFSNLYGTLRGTLLSSSIPAECNANYVNHLIVL